ncbi:MAG TPA: hypothetical protein VMT24_15505 [Aggregatilineaceae bacterium]|nr:hypothetical protein [Aggregatilineaceae bacterium]
MTTEDMIIHIFCYVDDALRGAAKDARDKMYPSEVVSISILFSLKGGHFRAVYRRLKRDFDAVFGGLPDRTTLRRQLRAQEELTNSWRNRVS